MCFLIQDQSMYNISQQISHNLYFLFTMDTNDKIVIVYNFVCFLKILWEISLMADNIF